MAVPGVGVLGGRGDDLTEGSNGDLVLARIGARKGWPVSNEVREKVLATAIALLDHPDAHKRLLACRAIILADSLNVRREATQSQEQMAILTLAQDRLRQALSDPVVRRQLLALSESQTRENTPPTTPDP